MKLERISPNQIRYSITFEELKVRGFIQEDIMKESFIWDELFDEMLVEASKIFELEECEAVAIEIFSLTSKELVLILTLDDEEQIVPRIEKVLEEDITEKENFVFSFHDIEHCISLAKAINQLQPELLESSLYAMEDIYYLVIKIETIKYIGIETLCQEFGCSSLLSSIVLNEYGKLISQKQAIATLCKYF
ncbi:adaptor protein MecA [Lederbergia lenta]|uniref:Genetic competence negative regulator n=1 Tax=Lederbergia lenta TaxID=1467 RepID=A0A2X4WFZ4_LEDLE|nr:adaptor protein MecA [Lederbergia lenta]MEC2324983.1 adaptor protein MecA [Lederbergia lenta]SQI56520.1 genetic competence negative regulator [Lederbergia lenta]